MPGKQKGGERLGRLETRLREQLVFSAGPRDPVALTQYAVYTSKNIPDGCSTMDISRWGEVKSNLRC